MTSVQIPKPEMGYNGFIQFAPEASYGKAVTATRRLAYVRPTNPTLSNSLDTERFLQVNGRDIPTPLMGNLDVSMPVEMRASELTLLKYVLGSVSSTTTAPTYTHTLTPANTIPSMTFYVGIDSTSNHLQKITGCKVARYTLAGSEGAPWVERFDLICSSPAYSTTITALSSTTIRPYEWFDSKVEWSYNGSTYTEIPQVRAFEFIYDNDLKGERYLASYTLVTKRCINSCHEGVRAYGIRLTKDFVNATEFKEFLGSTTVTTPQLTPFAGKLRLTLTRAANDKVVLTMGALYINNPGWMNKDNASPVQYNLELVGKTLTNIVVTNTTATYW